MIYDSLLSVEMGGDGGDGHASRNPANFVSPLHPLRSRRVPTHSRHIKIPLSLAAATASDVSAIIKIETEFSASYPVFHYLFPKGVTPIRLASLNDDYQKMLSHDTSAHQLKVTDSATGEIVAVGRWHIYRQPRSDAELERDKERVWSPDARSDEDCQEFSDLLTEARKRVMGGGPHLYKGSSLVMAPRN